MFDLVRNLSNVSTQFREDLAGVIWARTEIVYEGYERPKRLTIAFLQNRPAIHPGVRSLTINMLLNGIDIKELPTHKLRERIRAVKVAELTNFFHYAASNLSSLEILKLDLRIWCIKEILPSLLSGIDDLQYILAVKDIPVSKAFTINLLLNKSELDLRTQAERDKYCVATKKNVLRTLTNMLMPVTLQAPDRSTVTDYDRYLVSRIIHNSTTKDKVPWAFHFSLGDVNCF